MAEIQASLREDSDRKPKKRKELPPGTAPAAPSVADEIAKLRGLHDEGVLTDEQYAKALDRVIAGTD
jgi:hypothetical protein